MDQTTENKDIEIDLNKFIYIIIFTIVAAIVSGLITHFCVKPRYSATTKMYVYSNTDRISTDSTITSTELTASQDLVNTYIYILKSDTVLEAVIKDLDLNISPSALRSGISAQQADKTVAFEVTVTASGPKTAATIAALAAMFISFVAFFLYELFDTTITSERDIIGEFDIPILGTVPNLENNTENSKYPSKDSKIVGTKTVNKKSDTDFVLKPSDEILENIQNAKGDDK